MGRDLGAGPTHRIDCLWHRSFPPPEATRVCVTFTPLVDSTIVRPEQTGWERLGERGSVRCEQTTTAGIQSVPSIAASSIAV